MRGGATSLLPTSASGDPAAHADQASLDELLGHAIANAHCAADAAFQLAVQDRSITPLRFSLLDFVGRHPGLQQVQIAEALELSPSAITIVIDYWQGRSCLVRKTCQRDRRSFGIFLTDEGTQTLRHLRRQVRTHEEMLCRMMTETERYELLRLLGKLRMAKPPRRRDLPVRRSSQPPRG